MEKGRMRKIIMYLTLCILSLGLVGCEKESSNTLEEVKIPEYKELTDPRGTSLESTATGEKQPQLVETLYATSDVVIADYVPTEMGYGVDPTGMTDSTAGIQQALYDCYDAGGGTVYLPAGNYAISDTIYIPSYVTLRGDWQDPDEGTEYGTIISVWMECEENEGAGAFKMGTCAGAVGLTLYYPMQTMDSIKPYGYAFWIEGKPNNSLATIKNVTIINGYRGIGTNPNTSHEMLQVENVKGTYLHCGMDAANGSDVGTVKNFVVNNKYWKEASADCMNAVAADVIDAYTKKYTTGMEFGDLEWYTYNNIAIDGCAIGIHTVPGVRVNFSGSMYDVKITNCAQGIVFDGLATEWGMVLAKSYVEGGIVNNTEAKVKLSDVKVKGKIVEASEQSITIDETDLSKLEIDYAKSYIKPKANVVVADLPIGLYEDAAPYLQKLLEQVDSEGGGVVYVPAGTYRFRSPITIPAGVELRGCSTVMTRDHGSFNKGTIFLCYYGDDQTDTKDGQAFITLVGEKAGVNGIRIVYPENSPYNEDYYTTYTIRGTAKDVYVVNTMISASAYGIDFSNCDNHYIEGVVTCCYYNAIKVGGNGGTVTKCLQNATVLVRTQTAGLMNWLKESDFFEVLYDPFLRYESEYIIIENAKDQVVHNVFAYGVKTGVTNINSENTFVNNLGSDNIGATCPMVYMQNGSMKIVNMLRSNGYSYEMEDGELEIYNRLSRKEVGEKTIIKNK